MSRLLLRALLWLYPASFRHQLGAAWLRTADQMLGRVRGAARMRVLARIVIDGVRAVPEAYRERERTWPLHRLAQDSTHAVRGLLRRPRFALTCIGVLAIGIGVNTAVFSVANAAFLRPLAYPEPGRLAVVWGDWRAADFGEAPLSPPQLMALSAADEVFADVGGLWASTATLTGGEYPEQISVGNATASLFSTLGIPPLLGRHLTDDDAADPGDPVGRGGVVLSHGFWERYFGADPEVLGRMMRLDGSAYEIVGVLAPRFAVRFPAGKGIPTHLDVFAAYPPLEYLTPGNFYLRVIGRLRPDVSVAEAMRALEGPAARLREQRADLADSGAHFDVRPLAAEWTSDLRLGLLGVQAAALLLLALTLTNVTSLMIAQAVARLPAFAIRASLGAGRGRLGRALVLEGIVLAGLAALTGLLLGSSGLSLLWSLRPVALERIADVGVDQRVALAAAAGALVAVAFLSAGPVWLLARTRPSRVLAGRPGVHEMRAGMGLRRAASVTQIATAFSLLVGTSLLAGTVANLQSVETGFRVADRLTFKVGVPLREFPLEVERARLLRELRQALLEVPGVREAGAGSHAPLGSWVNWASPVVPIEAPEDPEQQGIVDHRAVTPGYFAALGAELVAGREFDQADDEAGAGVAILDEVLATRLFGSRSALGREVIVSRWREFAFERAPVRVVGVVAPIRDRAPDRASEGQVYLPWAQTPRWEVGFVLWAPGETIGAESIRQAVASVGPSLAAAGLRPLHEDLDRALGPARFALLLARILALAAVALSAIGVYGVMTLETHTRHHEIGVRLAVGARAAQVARLIFGAGLRLAILGVLVGVPLALAFARVLRASLYLVDPSDPRLYLPGAVLAVLTGVAAAALPARRATRCDPASSLRASGS